jgi:LysR family pca operon transcriptional activator
MTALLDSRIKLRHVSAFLETVREGGVARAGTSLGMTQPAVSKAIIELEDILGVALFDRSRRALTLTAYGEMFARFAESGLANLRQGVETIEEARTGAKFIAFGALPSAAAGLVPEALRRFATTSFACRTLVENGPSPYLLDLLRRGAIDFVVGRMAAPAAMEGLSFEHLYVEELALVVRPGHPLAAQSKVDLAALARFQVVIPPRQGIIRPAVDALLIAGRAGRPVNPLETVSNSLGRGYTLASDAVWIVSAGVVARDITAGELVRLAVDVSTTLGAVGITMRSGGDPSVPVRAMLDCLRETAASQTSSRE